MPEGATGDGVAVDARVRNGREGERGSGFQESEESSRGWWPRAEVPMQTGFRPESDRESVALLIKDV